MVYKLPICGILLSQPDWTKIDMGPMKLNYIAFSSKPVLIRLSSAHGFYGVLCKNPLDNYNSTRFLSLTRDNVGIQKNETKAISREKTMYPLI